MGSHLTVNGNITGTKATQTSIMGLKSLVLGQTNDINGISYISVQNRTGVHRLQIATMDSSLPVIVFLMVIPILEIYDLIVEPQMLGVE